MKPKAHKVGQKAYCCHCHLDRFWRTGFTLIEMLVVISIISLLMGILMPTLSRARNSARRISCAAQMRQIALAFEMWSIDHDDWTFVADSARTYSDGDWFHDLLPYVCKKRDTDLFKHKEELWLCPCDKNPYPVGVRSSPHTIGVTSYALNGIYRKGRAPRPEVRLGPAGGFKTFQVPMPSAVMLMLETSYERFVADCEHPKAKAVGLSALDDIHHRRTSGFYHNNSMNIVFVDGHIGNIRGRKAEWVDTPSSIQRSHGMFWNDLTLPSATEQPELWGPGYRK